MRPTPVPMRGQRWQEGFGQPQWPHHPLQGNRQCLDCRVLQVGHLPAWFEEDAAANINLSGPTASNAFSSPDGLWFSKATGICWIQTDDGAYTDETNRMLLAAIPGTVGDGAKITVDNSMTVSGAEVTGKQETFIGAALGDAKLRRFLVAPKVPR